MVIGFHTSSGTDRRRSEPKAGQRGFTLLELMVVMAVMLVLAAIAVPSYLASIKKAKEAVLKEDLHTMRVAIDSYTADKAKAPQSLDDLVQAGYIKTIPKDPITSRTDTWITGQSGSLTTIDETEPGIDDVHSGAQETSTEGTSYSTW